MNFAFIRSINQQIDRQYYCNSVENDLLRLCRLGRLDDIVLNYHNIYIDILHFNDDKPLQTAVIHGHLNVVKFLIQKGANVHANNNYVFEIATRKGYLNLIQYFVKFGYDIDNDFYLNIAVERGYLDIVKYLCSENHNVKNDTIKMAVECGHMNILKYFMSLGYPLPQGVLKYACDGSNINITKYLISLGAEIDDDVIKIVAKRRQCYHGQKIYDYIMGLNNLTLRNRILMACCTGNLKIVKKLTVEIDGVNACIHNFFLDDLLGIDHYIRSRENRPSLHKIFQVGVHLIKHCGANFYKSSNIKNKKLREYIENRIKSKAIRMLYTVVQNKYSIPHDICKIIQSYI